MTGTRPSLFLACATTAIAGYIDAVGFVHLSGLYLSFMTGNTTRLGVLISQAHWDAVAFCLAVIGSFVAGSALGTLLADRVTGDPVAPVLTAEASLVGVGLAFSLFGDRPFILLPLVVAMGMQNVLHRTVSGADAGRTFVTGTLFSLGQSLADLASGKGRLLESGILLASWVAFVAGALFGGLVVTRLHLPQTLAVALAMIGLMAVWARSRSAVTGQGATSRS